MGGLQNDDLASISRRLKLKEDILTAVSKVKPQGNLSKRTDYSAFRTPSGQYYCAACNLSLNSDSQFGQHQVRAGVSREVFRSNIFSVSDKQETQTKSFSKVKKKIKHFSIRFFKLNKSKSEVLCFFLERRQESQYFLSTWTISLLNLNPSEPLASFSVGLLRLIVSVASVH